MTSSFKHQEDYECLLNKQQEEIERFIQQHQNQILELEIELIRLNKFLLNRKFHSLALLHKSLLYFLEFAHSSYHFNPTSSSMDILTPASIPLLNSSLLKLCPSGIWV